MIRDRLKKERSFSVGALDKKVQKRASARANQGGEDNSQAGEMMKLVEKEELIQLFKGVEKTGETACADVYNETHWETWPIQSKNFRCWLIRKYLENTGKSTTRDCLNIVMDTFETKVDSSKFLKKPVFVRVGGLNENLYIDLCDTHRRGIEVTESGWKIKSAQEMPVRFLRDSHIHPLPEPETGGSIESLRRFINVKSDDDFWLVAGWLLGALREGGPYPVLVLSGEQGSSKSTVSRFLKELVDPHTVMLRNLYRTEEDLFITTKHNYILAFDNLSRLSVGASDILCRLSTGGGFSTRKKYTNIEEVVFNATRPVILNAIADIVTRDDLIDRCLFIYLEPIPDNRQRTEQKIFEAFKSKQPKIFGALLDMLVNGLKNLP